MPSLEPFSTPKPEGLIKRIFELFSNKGDIVLDSFAGSGTSAAVALKMGRKFIAVEMVEDVSSYIVPRLKLVVAGDDPLGISEEIGWEGGSGFRFCRLGVPLFDEFGDIAAEVEFPDLAAHIFFSETGVPIPRRATSEYLGTHQGRAVYLLFDAANAQAPREAAGNVLTLDRLAGLPASPEGFEGLRVVYAEGCTVSADRLKAQGVVFKQIPYQVEGV